MCQFPRFGINDALSGGVSLLVVLEVRINMDSGMTFWPGDNTEHQTTDEVEYRKSSSARLKSVVGHLSIPIFANGAFSHIS